MAMTAGILGAALRLVLLTAFGFGVFKIEPVRRRLLAPLLFLTLNVFLPLYFIHNTSANWAEVTELGLLWPAVFFFGCLVLMVLQTCYGSWLVRRERAFRESEQPRELIALFATHNAGYIPLPILAAIAPSALQVYMFFVVLAFNLVFWTFAVTYVSEGSSNGAVVKESKGGESHAASDTARGRWRRYLPQLNMPIIGVLAGVFVAALDLYRFVPAPVVNIMAMNAEITMELMLVVLGGVLASIPNEHLRYRPEFGRFVFYKLVLFPAAFFAVLMVLPLPGIGGEIEWGVRLAILLQAAVPPATNLMIVTKNYGSLDQVRFAGSAILYTYIAAAVTLPLFMLLAHWFL